MQPVLELRRVAADAFGYSLSAIPRDPTRPPQDLFSTVEYCLYDAGRSLQNYFDSVIIRYDGISLGAFPVMRLVNDTLGLFDEIMARLIATFRMRTRSYATAPRPEGGTMVAPILSTTGEKP